MKLREMTLNDIDAVLAIEQQVHAHPWSGGNFVDALQANYLCRVLEIKGDIIAYAVLMLGVDEAELLDIGVAAAHQRQGWGKKLLLAVQALANDHAKQNLLLEVRASNAAAIALYQGVGFQKIGLRRAYYPADGAREDAILMGLTW
jgi:ribosomal-protein-alanine N-acetyltransferase